MAENADWQDATELIGRTASDLPKGHMLYQEGYSMFEAMSALELMDPKMDSGTGYQRVRTYEERVASAEIRPISSLSWEEALSAMDFVERAQVAFWDGASAAQTTFTLHYFYHAAMTSIAPNTATLPHRFLDLFCKFTLRSDEDVRDMVSRSGVLDEEDFVTMNYGWPSGDALREDELLRAAKELLELSSGGAPLALAQERLRVRRALYMALLALERTQLDAARKHLTVIANRAAPAAVAPLPDTFLELYLIRRFEIPAAPRPVAIPDSAAGHRGLTLFASRLLQSIEHSAALLTPISFIDLLARLRPIAAWGQVERARLAQLISREEVKMAVIRNYMLEAGLPKLLLESKQVTEGPFLKRADGAMQLFLQTLCYNKSRSRRRMVHVFEELAALTGDALVADSMRSADSPLYGPFFTTWTQDMMLASMIIHLEAGLSAEGTLQLYHPRELPWLFFYLEILHTRRVHNLRQMAALAVQAARKRKGAAKKKSDEPGVSPLLQQAELHYLITKAIVWLFTSHTSMAKQSGKSEEETFPFGSNELRWATRFYALARTGGHVPGLPYGYYAKVINERLARPTAELIKETTDAIEQVKERVKPLLNPAEGSAALPVPLQEEAKKIARVAVLNGLNLAKNLLTKRATPLPREAHTDFATHPIYPVLQF